MINEWKKEQRNLLVLDAGDLLYPTVSAPPMEDQKPVMDIKAKAVVEAFNLIGCDAVTVGDDDLLWGKENLQEILKGAAFPVLSANLIDTESGEPLFKPYIIREMEGLRVGIFGLFYKPPQTEGRRLNGITILDPLVVAPKMISTLREKCDFVILLSHLGYAGDLEMAKKVAGINIIVGGHTGINLSHPRVIGNTVVLQVGKKGRRLGRVDLTITDPSRSFVNAATREMLKERLDGMKAQLQALDEQDLQDSPKMEPRRKVLEQRTNETERALRSYEGQNELVNRIVPLTQEVNEDPECQRVLEPYLLRISQADKTSPPKGEPSQPSPEARSE